MLSTRGAAGNTGRFRLFLLALPLAGPQRLVEVLEDVVDVLQAHRQPHQLRRHAGLRLLLGGKLLVRRAGRMDHQRLGVADVGQVGVELDAVDEFLARLEAAADPEGDEGACPRGRYFLARSWYGLSGRPG